MGFPLKPPLGLMTPIGMLVAVAVGEESDVNETLHRLPFENRWTSGERARHWYQRLEREGVKNVRLRQALRDAESDQEGDAIPHEFIAAWLDYHTRESERRTARWRWTILVIVLVAAIGAIVAAWYSARAYHRSEIGHLQTVSTRQGP